MDFKQFLQQQIAYYTIHFKRNLILLDECGELVIKINISFEYLLNRYQLLMNKKQNKKQQDKKLLTNQQEKKQFKINQFSSNTIKITDQDLKDFWKYLNCSYNQIFNVQNQNITDQTLLNLAELFRQGRCGFKALRLARNNKFTQVGIAKLGQSLRQNKSLKEINLKGLIIGSTGTNRIIQLISITNLQNIDLGLIGNQSLKYLAKVLQDPHKLENISFGQNNQNIWQQSGKNSFHQIIRKGQHSRQILSINLYPENLINHYSFISQLCIISKKNRNLKVDVRENEFKANSLNPSHPKYYDPNNHSLNAYKFSVKSYLTNVFGSLLDEALYFLQKQRRNSLRQQSIFEITKQPINKKILEDICTADGSIIVLTKYLLAKISEMEE